MKEAAEREFLGVSVVTRYNNKSYRIDEVDFSASPKSTFVNSKGEVREQIHGGFYRHMFAES